jgi:hypothetical protein
VSLRRRLERLELPSRAPQTHVLIREKGESRAEFERRCEEAQRRSLPGERMMVFDFGGGQAQAVDDDDLPCGLL